MLWRGFLGFGSRSIVLMLDGKSARKIKKKGLGQLIKPWGQQSNSFPIWILNNIDNLEDKNHIEKCLRIAWGQEGNEGFAQSLVQLYGCMSRGIVVVGKPISWLPHIRSLLVHTVLQSSHLKIKICWKNKLYVNTFTCYKSWVRIVQSVQGLFTHVSPMVTSSLYLILGICPVHPSI